LGAPKPAPWRRPRAPMMKVLRAYRAELSPNQAQRALLLRHDGAARFTYNWGLTRRIKEYAASGRSLNAIALHRELNKLKKTVLQWMYEVSKCAPQEALRDLDKAFQNFFEERTNFPRFRSKKRGAGGFRLTGTIKAARDRIQLPRIGTMRLKEKGYLPTTGVHILSATVSESAGHWFVSLQVEEEIQVPANCGPVVGVDLGLPRLATVSDGATIDNPKALKRYDRKLRRLQRSLSRKKKGSKNKEKERTKLARCYYRVACIRRDALHKATTMLAKTKSVIGVEDLAVANMMTNHNLASSVADAAPGEFMRMLEYKAAWYGCTLARADRFYPSTKRCSRCGAVKAHMSLSERVFMCDVCGLVMDRDLNSALNLEQVAASWAETVNACKRREVHAVGQVPAHEAGTEMGRLRTTS
jgi:putative transposase